jgi:hypothetical protein
MTTCERRIHALAHSRTRVRADNRTSVQLQLLDTTSCAIALFAWLAGALHRANALFICRMQEVEFNIIDIIGVTYAPRAYRTRFDPPPSIRRAGANAKDVPTHPHPLPRKQVLT